MTSTPISSRRAWIRCCSRVYSVHEATSAAGVTLRALRTITPEQARALAELLGPTAGRLLLEFHAALGEAPASAELPAILRPVLDRAWQDWLQEQVRAELEACGR